MTKESLKDKLDGTELDLSLNELAVVPVKELAALPRATHLDLSCNLLTSLPPEFCQLTHLVRVDLSKNAITELPADIGNLARLQHLDLFANKLTSLPMGLCHLKNLRWLDIRKNPLTEQLEKVAGDCLNDVQCKACAKNIVAYMKNVQSEHERQRQQMLQEEREREAQQRVEEERQKVALKVRRKAEKEQRKRDYEAAQAAKLKAESRKAVHQSVAKTSTQPSNGVETEKAKEEKKDGRGCCAGFSIFMAMLVAVLAIFAGIYFYCETNTVAPWCREVKGQIDLYQKMALQAIEQYRPKKDV